MSLIRILIPLLILAASVQSLTAQVTPDAAAPSTHQPTVSTVNTVPVVTITAPGAGGISWNQYTQFNVGAPGLVFNNALTGVPSVLTGTTLPANPNFTGSAALVILNEVTSTQSSNLNGAMEIAGQTASLIIANPNGITINGASTLNTSRLTLTTGTPSLDASNKLNLQVQQGTLKIGPGGLNTSTATGTELIAEKIQLEGFTQAGNGDLTIQGGKQTYHWSDKTTTASTSAGTGYAIDGTALGAAQAGSIKIIASQSGVGVRAPGNLAASTGDITLDAHGNIVVGQAKAKRDVKIKSTASTVATQGTIQGDRDVVLLSKQDLAIQAPITAERHVGIATDATAAIQGVIHAAGAAEASAQNLTISSDAGIWTGEEILVQTTGSIDQAGTLSSDSWIGITAGGSYALSGLTRATDDIAISAATLTLAPEAQIDSGNNLIIGASGAINIGTLAVLQAESGISISTPLSLTNRGIIKASDIVTLQSGSSIDNQGAYITADAVQINAAQAFDNSQFGTIQAGGIGLWINTHTLLNLSGYIISGNIIDLQLGIGGLNNTGGVIWAQENGDLLITTPGTIINHYGYLFADRDIDLWAVEKIDNLVGTIQAGRHAWLTTARLENRRTPVVRITGGNGRDFDDVETSDLAILSADGDLTITLESAPGLKDGSLLNDASILGAGGNLTITGASLVNNAHTLMHERWERKKPSFPSNIWSKPKWILKERWSTGTASTGQAGGIISINLTDSFHNTGNWIGSQFHLTATTIINGITNYYTPTPASTVPRRQASFGMDSLPTPTNALFQTSRDPASLYIVTSTVPYNTDLELTPAALAERLGIQADPSTTRFFADPLYEAYLLERQAMADLGQRFYFDDVSTMREQRARLYENALALHQSFPDLALGEILTEAHLASLTEPVIWYEYEDLRAYRAALADYERRLADWERAQSLRYLSTSSKHDIPRDLALASSPRPEPPTHIIPEQRILVPTIYLPQPLEQYAQIYGGRIQAHEATLRARDRIHNTGYINTRDDLTLAAGEIRNERRVAQAVATVQIKDVFETRTRNVFYDQIQEGGEISAGGNITILAGDAGITNIGGLIIGGEKVHLETTGSIYNDAQRGEFIVNWNRGTLGAIFSMKSWDKGVLFIGGQIVAGDDLLILAGDTITNRGSTIEAVGDVTLSAPRLIEQDIHAATYTSYQGASIQGLGFNFATQKEIVTARSSIISHFGDVTLHSAEGDIRNIGSSLLAAYDLTLFAGQNIILDARTTEAIESAGGFSIAGTEISYHEAEWNKTKTETSLLSAGRNITLEAGHDIRSVGSFILSENDILLLAANDILFDQHTVRKWHISSGWTMAVDFFGSNIINTAIKGGDVGQAALSLLPGSDIIQGEESIFNAQDEWDYAAAATRLAVQGWNTAASVAKGINQRAAAKSSGQNPVSTPNQSSSLLQSTPIVNDPSGGAMSMLGIGQVSFRVDVWDKEDHWTESHRNILHAGGDLTIQAGRDVTLAGGSRFTADGDIDIIAARSLRLLAGEDSFRSTYETSGGSVGVDLFSGGISLSGRHSQSRSNGTTYTPTFIGTPGTLRIQTGSDAHVQGSLAMANNILADIGGNLTIESLQDKFNSTSWGMSANIGFGAGVSVGGSFNYAKASRAWIGEQAGFIAENSLDVDVDGHTHLRGALIQGAEGQSRFKTAFLSYEDIHDYDKSESFGISMNYSGIAKPAGQGQSGIPGMIGFSYLKADKRGVVRSTVSGAEVETIEVQDLSGLNRAIDRAREITRDKKTKVKLVVPIINPEGMANDWDAMKAAWKEITKRKEVPESVRRAIEVKQELEEAMEKEGVSKERRKAVQEDERVNEVAEVVGLLEEIAKGGNKKEDGIWVGREEDGRLVMVLEEGGDEALKVKVANAARAAVELANTEFGRSEAGKGWLERSLNMIGQVAVSVLNMDTISGYIDSVGQSWDLIWNGNSWDVRVTGGLTFIAGTVASGVLIIDGVGTLILGYGQGKAVVKGGGEQVVKQGVKLGSAIMDATRALPAPSGGVITDVSKMLPWNGSGASSFINSGAETLSLKTKNATEWFYDGWKGGGAGGTETAVAYRAINPAYAESTAQSGQFFRSGAAGRLGNDGIYANSTIEGAIAEFQFHNPGVNPAVFRVQYPVSPTLNISPPSGYFSQPLPFTQGANILTAPSLRAPGTVNLLIREGAVPAGRIQ